MIEPVQIPSPETPETVVASVICPKCGQKNKFCPACGGRFCANPDCTAKDEYHREECRDALGD